MLAHTVPSRSDLPVPLWVAQYGAVAVMIAAFLVLGARWRSPRLQDPDRGRILPGWLQRLVDAPATRVLLRAAGVGGVLAILVVAAVGPRSGAVNPAATWLSVWLWAGVVPASLLLGPVWRALNPLRTITAALHRVTGHRIRPLPAGLGYWPAAIGLAGFGWLMLASPGPAGPGTVLGFLLGYGAVQVTAATVYGPAWYARGDAFEVVSGLLGRLGPIGRRGDGRLVVRNPLRGAACRRPGQVAVLCVLLGTMAFDGLRGTAAWTELAGLDGLFPDGTVWMLAGAVGLLGCIGVIAVTYLAAVSASLALASPGSDATLYSRFAACLLPVAGGCGVAHSLSLLVAEGRRGYVLASDPVGRGWDLLGVAGWTLADPAAPAAAVGLVQLGAIVVGHVLAVVLAHDGAVASLPAAERLRGQYPLLLVMAAWAVGGVTLMFGT